MEKCEFFFFNFGSLCLQLSNSQINFPSCFARIKFSSNGLILSCFEQVEYNMYLSMDTYHYILYISIQIYGQPTLLLWHDTQAYIVCSHWNSQKWHHFVWKSLNIFWGDPQTPPPPFNHNCFRFYNVLFVYIIKWKSSMQPLHSHTLYAHTGSLQKYKKNHLENPVLPPFWTNIPSPSFVFFFVFFFFAFFFFCFSKILLQMIINILALVIPENKFSGQAHVENK